MRITMDLTINSSVFSRLLVHRYKSERMQIPVEALPTNVKTRLETFYRCFTGEQMTETPLIVNAKDGAFNRLYGPSIVSSDDSLVLRWGSQRIPLKLGQKGALELVQPDGWEADVSVGTYDFHGKGLDPSLDITFTKGEDIDVLHCSFRPATEDYNAARLQSAIKRADIKALAREIAPEGVANPVYSLKELPEGTYRVIDAREVATSHGTSYVLTVTSDTIKPTQIWANQTLKRALSTKPMLSEQTPGFLTIHGHRTLPNGKVSSDVSITFSALYPNPESISLNF